MPSEKNSPEKDSEETKSENASNKAKASKQNKKQSPAHSNATQLKITLTRSLLGRPEKHLRVAHALGLRKSQRFVLQYDTPIIRGMINKISHLLTVETA
jgi:large subunit ribosomal protein L30